METHHPHHPTHKKKWTEYLLEFFMLFLAVFLGFVAENIRENSVERHREKEYIKGFIQNLKTDTLQLSRQIKSNIHKTNVFDSLLLLSYSDLTLPANVKKFYAYFISGSYVPTFTPSDATITQLKNSGALRLIANKNLSDSILYYDAANKRILEHNKLYDEVAEGRWNTSYAIMDTKILRDTSYINFMVSRKMTAKQPPPLHIDPLKFQLFTGYLTREILFTEVNRGFMTYQKNRAERLISLLQKEYHLEND